MNPKYSHLVRDGDPALPDAGQMVGDCIIIRTLGAGAMGVVYHAVRKLLKREVALKMLPPAIRDKSPVAIKRFLREAQSAARLDHPNIVKVYNIGEDGPWVYIEMEFVKGKSLADDIEKNPMSELETIRLGCELASALGYAHQHGVIHRDIKPENIMLTHQRQSKIADFGLAGFAGLNDFKENHVFDALEESDDSVRLTKEGAMMGTPSFMSPEQFYGLTLDGRSDLYSLGCTFFCMLTGLTPLQTRRELPRGNTIKLLDEHFKSPPVEVHQFCPHISQELAQVVSSCMSLRPDGRPATGEELRERLLKALSIAEHKEKEQMEKNPQDINVTASSVREQSQMSGSSEEEMWKSFSNLMRGQ